MSECPHCGATLTYLNAYSLEENKQEVSLDEDGHLDWSTSDPVEETCEKIDFECPDCGHVIYSNKGNSTDPEITRLLSGGEKTESSR